MKIRKNDQVLVISGRDRGKRGKVRLALPQEQRVVVEGLNLVKRHQKARGAARQAGIISVEAPLPVSKVMLVCNKCDRPTRVAARFLEDGRKVRGCKRCGEAIE